MWEEVGTYDQPRLILLKINFPRFGLNLIHWSRNRTLGVSRKNLLRITFFSPSARPLRIEPGSELFIRLTTNKSKEGLGGTMRTHSIAYEMGDTK